MARRPRLFVVSGPAGVGKGTLVARVRQLVPTLGLTVSATTRAPRPGEVDGREYHFLTDEEFDRDVADGAFLEWAWVHGYRYGTPRSELARAFGQGLSVILEIDVQGGFHVREAYPEAVLVFVEPPSMEELERRLRSRGTEAERDVERRLADAAGEIRAGEAYDVRITNDVLEDAAQELARVIGRYETEGEP